MIKVNAKLLRSFLKERNDESHKGDYGHALLVCGCTSMPGAACLSTGAALQSGCGLVTLHSTANATQAALVNYPSAMLSIDPENCLSVVPTNLKKYSVVGIGPGLGTDPKTVSAFKAILSECQKENIPMVLDADALNILSQNKDLLDSIPKGSVMTPHMGELKRLVGEWANEEKKIELLHNLSRRTGAVIVAKGFRTKIYSPSGDVYENTTGNPGMAKGGSGDVLTGLVTGLVARGYSALEAALLGVWIHGYTGDFLSEERTQEAYSSKDMIDSLCEGFEDLYF